MTLYLGKRNRDLSLEGSDDVYDPSDYNAAAVTYWGASPPPASRRQLDSDFITSLQSAGLFAKLDALWILGQASTYLALRNVVKRAHDCTLVNAPTFTPNRGYAGDGVSSCLNTNYNPNTQGVKLLQNDCSFGMYSRTNIAASQVDMGVNISGTRLDGTSRNASGNMSGAINSSTAFVVIAQANSLGLSGYDRTASNAQRAYRNGVQVFSNSGASTGVPNGNIYLLARHTGSGGIEQPSTRQIFLAWFGGLLGGTGHSTMFTLIEAYADALGAGVI